MKSSGFDILQPAALTMLSGLVILIAATLALGSMAQDQSGQSVAMVAKSFRAEMHARDDECRLIPIAGDVAQDSAMTQPGLPGHLEMSCGQVKDNADLAREFANLLSELDRVAGTCAIDAPVRELRINVATADLESVTAIINQSCNSLYETESVLLRDEMHVELQTWAASPTPTAWISAIREANCLRAEVRQELSVNNAPKISFGSSAAIGRMQAASARR
ncbi:MAG: hypothetical protein WKF77_02890 [Planctomycetaceae bacterium]